MAATKDCWPEPTRRSAKDSEERFQISLVNISGACFHAKANGDHPVYVELPPEDPDHGGGLCGKLNVHMYGTRLAADGWHCECNDKMK